MLRGGLGAYAPYKLKAAPQVEGIAMPGTLQAVPMLKVGLGPETGLTSVEGAILHIDNSYLSSSHVLGNEADYHKPGLMEGNKAYSLSLNREKECIQ